MGAYGTATRIPYSPAEKERRAMVRKLERAVDLLEQVSQDLHHSQVAPDIQAEVKPSLRTATQIVAQLRRLLNVG